VKSATLAKIDETLDRVNAGAPIASIDASHWSTQEWLRFLNGLPRKQAPERLAELDKDLGLSKSINAYVRSAWLVLAAQNHYDPAIPSMEDYLPRIGRGLLIFPVYRALKAEGGWGLPIAKRIYAGARANYHPTVAATLDKTLDWKGAQ
jgi:hypothetical protein